MPSLLSAPLYRYTYRYTFKTQHGEESRLDWKIQTTQQSSDYLAHENSYGNVRCEYVSKEHFTTEQAAILALYSELLSRFDPSTDFSDDSRVYNSGREAAKRIALVGSKLDDIPSALAMYNSRIRDSMIPSVWPEYLLDAEAILAWKHYYKDVLL